MKNYNRNIRKMVVAFGNLFDDITLTRYNKDDSEQEHMKVPISYATKERYVMRLENDPELDKKVQITLPRMSFELNGLTYDSSRKQITNIKNYAQSSNPDKILSQYNPVPYDFDFSLYIYVRNIEDGTQIIERILPFFTPDYTLKLNLIPEMGIVKDIPVILKSTNYEIDYQGDRESETRIIIWTLNFTVKGFIYGAISEPGLIKTTITNVLDNTFVSGQFVKFIMSPSGFGTYKEGEYVYQGFNMNTATATAKVTYWDPMVETLTLTDLDGHFINSKKIIGAQSNAQWLFDHYTLDPVHLVKFTVTPEPPTANVNSEYTYNVEILEFPDAG